MSSCILYRYFKLDLNLEKYLMLLDSSDRINICRFRCRNTKIPVVTLSYANINIPYEDRLCTLCNTSEVGDEFHYIFKCPVFHSDRNKYLSNYLHITITLWDIIIKACSMIGCPYHTISLCEHDWLILNYGVILARGREWWIWAQAQVIVDVLCRQA